MSDDPKPTLITRRFDLNRNRPGGAPSASGEPAIDESALLARIQSMTGPAMRPFDGTLGRALIAHKMAARTRAKAQKLATEAVDLISRTAPLTAPHTGKEEYYERIWR